MSQMTLKTPSTSQTGSSPLAWLPRVSWFPTGVWGHSVDEKINARPRAAGRQRQRALTKQGPTRRRPSRAAGA